MKKTLFALSLLAAHFYSFAQAPSILWQKTYGGSHGDDANSIALTSDGGYIVGGQTSSPDGDVTGYHAPLPDAWVTKISATGNLEWQKDLGGSDGDDIFSVQQTYDGNYAVFGYTNSIDGDVTGHHGANLSDYWLVKLSVTGSILWQKALGGTSYDQGNAMCQTADSGFILTGYSSSTDGDVTGNHGGADIWVVKLSSTGSIVWEKSFGGSGFDGGYSVQQTADGGYVIAGSNTSSDGNVTGNHGGSDYWVVKLSPTGALQWQKSLGGSNTDQATFIRQTLDGGYIVTGNSRSTDGDVTGHHGLPTAINTDMWTVKLDAAGNIQWQVALGGSSDDYGTSIVQSADSGYIVAGYTSSADGDVSVNHGYSDEWLVKLSPTGSIVWQKTYGGSLSDNAQCIQHTPDGSYILAGTTSSSDGDVTGFLGTADFWVTKLSCPAADPITGATHVCAGNAITLTDAATGGIWEATNRTAALAGNVLTGTAPGIDTIVYSLITSCGAATATTTITVDTVPAPVITHIGHTLSTTTSFSSYQWTLGGMPITGATNATYYAIANGLYGVDVTNTAGCTGAANGYSLAFTGIAQTFSNTTISIYPNPTQGNVFVTGILPSSIQLYNSVGQLVRSLTGTDHISLAEFSSGLYFINIYDEGGRMLTRSKIIKE